MITQCTRCGHEINTDTEEGSEQGVTRGWDGQEEGYRDYHRLCRDLTITEAREARRPGQVASGESKRRGGRQKSAGAAQEAGAGHGPVPVVDEMD